MNTTKKQWLRIPVVYDHSDPGFAPLISHLQLRPGQRRGGRKAARRNAGHFQREDQTPCPVHA